MEKKTIITLLAGLLFLSTIKGYGQEIISIEQEREIKVSGNYYFGECSATDEAEAKECALKELTQEVIVALLQQAIVEKKEVMLKNIEMLANTAHLPTSGRIRILAYIAKDSIFVQNVSVGDSTIAKPEEMAPKKELQTEISTEEQQSATTDEILSCQVISNPIIQDLAKVRTFDQFRRKANSWRRQGKLVYGSRKTAFLRPDDCHIAVFLSTGTLIALLDKGNNFREDLLTGKTVQNPEQKYKESELIWIQINN